MADLLQRFKRKSRKSSSTSSEEDRERVLNKARKLKGKVFGISADLPKEIVDRRKKFLPKFFAAKKAGKPAYFSRAEPSRTNYLLTVD